MKRFSDLLNAVADKDIYKMKRQHAIASVNDEISGKEKEQAILNSDIFIMTSRFEGHPMGMIEALAYGLPCVVSEGTNMAGEIKEADAGWTCEGNVRSIQNALLSAIREKDQYVTKSNNSLTLAKEYNWTRLAKIFHDELKRLLSQSHKTDKY